MPKEPKMKTADVSLASEIKKAPQIAYIVIALDPEVKRAHLEDGSVVEFIEGQAIVDREQLVHFADEKRFRCVTKEILPNPTFGSGEDKNSEESEGSK